MENALNQTNIPTFQSKETKTHQSPLIGNALHEPLPASFQRNRGTRRKRREYLKAKKKDHLSEKQGAGGEEEDDDDDDDDDKAEVKRKIVALQRIVPGGESLGVDKLFEETAGYILALQCQIKAMRVLSCFIEGLEKQKRKLGG
ncbi:transcription factor PAR1-like [Herrania umbratica]|uniref:Transcription factor PAR1-like n=1 Tax=Herrania umbratica TaxID=108875 RepID=A0A6J0ZIE7_9ROSI|nr:transcription factor PAR1-like [Herrania umbratica]